MANREELLIIRAARTGNAPAQLALGKRYLFGSASLPQSHTTALHWLEKAAEQNQQEAWMLIGEHISFEVASQVGDPLQMAFWYERAFESGSARAGLVFAMLMFSCWPRADQSLRQKAVRALQAAAEAGIPEAQWLYSQQLGMHELLGTEKSQQQLPQVAGRREQILDWAAKAAKGGVVDAQRALADYAWSQRDYMKFMLWALPMAQEFDRRNNAPAAHRRPLGKQQLILFTRCAKAMMALSDPNLRLIERYLKIAAEGGDADAQLSLGLWIARMDESGERAKFIPGVAHYKKAIRWLSQAAEQGSPAAWFAISRIYLKPEFSRRSITESRRFLEQAAAAGHQRAQVELGLVAWRARRLEPRADVRAVYWLQKAAGQGAPEAKALLDKIAPPVRKPDWAATARQSFNREVCSQYPFLAARVELAYWFGLTRAEALLIDVESADHGHCLEVDIRNVHPRSRRRLVQVQTGEQRQALERASRMFDVADVQGELGPEGNYRQRLYRFRSLIAQRRAQHARRA